MDNARVLLSDLLDELDKVEKANERMAHDIIKLGNMKLKDGSLVKEHKEFRTVSDPLIRKVELEREYLTEKRKDIEKLYVEAQGNKVS